MHVTSDGALCGVVLCKSKRRHTICLRDWSSDVCSSDLGRCSNTSAAVGAVGKWESRAFCGISKLGGKVFCWTFPRSVFSTAGHGPRFGKLHRRQVTQRRMRPDMIVFAPPSLADLLGLR